MRLFAPLFAYLVVSMQIVYAETSPIVDVPVYGNKLVVEKIVSDATAIETIVFESAPSQSSRTPTSSVSVPPKPILNQDSHKNGVIQNTNSEQFAQLSQGTSRRIYTKHPGGNIKVHGIKNGEWRSPSFIQSFDWTDGCIALTNQDMDQFIELVGMGTPIHIEW